MIPRLTGGGMERRMGLIATGMASRGYNVHAAYLDKGENADDVELNGVTLHEIKAANNYDIFMFIRLLLLVRKEKPDIIQTWSAQMDILGAIIVRLVKARWIMMEPSSIADCADVTWKVKLKCRLAKYATVVSNSLAGDMYWRDKTTCGHRVIRNGQQVQRVLDAPTLNRADMPVSNRDLILLYVGRLNITAVYQKNFQACLDVVCRLSSRIPPVKLLVCGDGSERGFWEKRVSAAGLENKVAFLGYLKREDVWGIMKIANALLSVSFFEGCPNVVQEAMLCKCPIIVSDIPEHREILTEEEALLVNPRSPMEVSRAVEELLSDEKRTAERAARAFMRANQWTVEQMLDQYEELYLDLVKPG